MQHFRPQTPQAGLELCNPVEWTRWRADHLVRWPLAPGWLSPLADNSCARCLCLCFCRYVSFIRPPGLLSQTSQRSTSQPPARPTTSQDQSIVNLLPISPKSCPYWAEWSVPYWDVIFYRNILTNIYNTFFSLINKCNNAAVHFYCDEAPSSPQCLTMIFYFVKTFSSCVNLCHHLLIILILLF